MRAAVVILILLVSFASIGGEAAHSEGKPPGSLGGDTVPRGATLMVLEAEAFEVRGAGSRSGDRADGPGAWWAFDTYGRIETEFELETAGVVWFDIRARGTHPDGMWNPHMHILIDGEQRGESDVRADWQLYPQAIPMLAGKHSVIIENFNNYRADVKPRTLDVDRVSLTMPTLDGTPRIAAGEQITIDAAEIHNSVTGMLERTTEARGGTQWRQWGIGCYAQLVILEASGVHTVTARLKGNVHGGVGTNVYMRVDGENHTQADVGTEWQEETATFTATDGPHLIEICYDNDLPGEKRNLWLDEMRIGSTVGGGWISAHGGYENHRSAPSAITAANIAGAREAWTYAADGPVTGTPAYSAGILYFADHGGGLHALRVADGSALWRVEIPAGVDSSVALDDQNVYLGDQTGWLSAWSRADGAPVWRVRVGDVEGTHLYGSPIIHDGVIYTGVASEQTLLEYKGEQDFRGSVAAFDAVDGELLWQTYTQHPGGLGVSVWSTPALDPELGLLFVGTGNSYGEPVSPFTDSILALSMSDGRVVWGYQATEEDGFDGRGASGPDRDFGASPVLFEVDGRKLVAEGDKGGQLFALDRATGELVWMTEVDFRVEGISNGRLEGFLGTPSYRDGVFYAPTTSRSMVHAIDASTGKLKWARELNPLPTTYAERMFAPSTAADGVILQGNAFGRVFALDALTGDILANLSAGGGVQGGISVDGSRFFVPHVGESLWSSEGGVTAFIVGAGALAVTTPTPATSPPPTTPEGEGAIGNDIPTIGVALIVAIAVASASSRARQRRRG